jgi:hypothetical protein
VLDRDQAQQLGRFGVELGGQAAEPLAQPEDELGLG